MPSPNGRRTGGRSWRAVAVALAVVAAGLVAFYAAVPWLVAALAPRLAAPLGLDELRLAAGRPGWRAMEVEALELASGRLRLAAGAGVVRYRVGEALSGRFASVHFERAVLRVEAVEGASAAGSAAPDVGSLFAALPADRLSVEMLEVEVPALEFRARGGLLLAGSRLDVHLDGLTPRQAERLELDGRISADGVVDFRVALRDGGEAPFVTVTTTVRHGGADLEGELSLRGFAFDLAAALAGLPAGDGSASGTFSATLPWPMPASWDWAAVAAEGRLRADWRPRGRSWSVTGAVADWHLEDTELRGEAQGAVVLGGDELRWRASASAFRPDEPRGDGELSLGIGGGRPLLAASWSLRPDALTLEGSYQASDAALRLLPPQSRPVSGRGALAGRMAARLPWPLPDRWQDPHPDAEGTLQGHWRLAGDGGAVRDVDGSWRLEGRRLAGALKGVVERHGLGLAVALELDALDYQDGVLGARGTAGLGNVERLPFALRHDPTTGAGFLESSGDVKIDGPLAAAVVEDWQEPYDVTAGAMSIAAELSWAVGSGLGGAVRVDLAGVAARFEDYLVEGLTGTLAFAAADGRPWSLEPAALRIARIHTGVELHDIDTEVAWAGDAVTVGASRARLLGGTAVVGAVAYRPSRGEADFVIDLTDVELARVLELEGEHVSGTGTLNGTLPVELRGNVPAIIAGRVRSEPPGGVIRVSSALAGGTGQPGLDFALRALQDFRYRVLEADVAYSGSGDMTLAVHLDGSNPDIEGGRPIHYNVTVNENVPTLLRSLRLQGELTREIERRVTD